MIVTVEEAQKMIAENRLFPVQHLWHYSFNIENYYEYLDFLNYGEGEADYLIAPKKLNQWAPLPIFTNQPDLESSKVVQGPGRFWFCKLTSFDDFLDRRSTLSQNPRKHFPSKQTFKKMHKNLNGSLCMSDLDPKVFQRSYDQLRRESHLNGGEVLSILNQSNTGTPKSWFKMMTLTVDSSTVGVGLLVDDGISQSLINLASIIDSNRYGLYMLTLWIRECCAQGLNSVDAGISGTYGIYKDQIFLDSKPERVPSKN